MELWKVLILVVLMLCGYKFVLYLDGQHKKVKALEQRVQTLEQVQAHICLIANFTPSFNELKLPGEE